MSDRQKKVLFTQEAISKRVKEVGKEISEKHPEGDLILVGILKGCFIFMADLIRSLDVNCEVDFARISSYGASDKSKGSLDIIMDVTAPLEDRTIILVDDIVDTGLTLSQYKDLLLKRGPKVVEVAALLDKTSRRTRQVDIDYVGFRIEDGFVVGYGLDFNECHRRHGCVYVLED